MSLASTATPPAKKKIFFFAVFNAFEARRHTASDSFFLNDYRTRDYHYADIKDVLAEFKSQGYTITKTGEHQLCFRRAPRPANLRPPPPPQPSTPGDHTPHVSEACTSQLRKEGKRLFRVMVGMTLPLTPRYFFALNRQEVTRHLAAAPDLAGQTVDVPEEIDVASMVAEL